VRTFVPNLDFCTSAGTPGAVITDLGVLTPDPVTRELQLSAMYVGVTIDQVRAACGWPLRVSASRETVAPPTEAELSILRELHERTREAHSQRVRVRLPF
jgi:glutaconate CoA-transferase, subunit B